MSDLSPEREAADDLVRLSEELGLYGDPCPQCGEADLEPRGGKHACPVCHYTQPCCNP